MTDQDEPPGDGSGPGEGPADGPPLEPLTGLADLDEDLRTMAQNSTELERWRRLSTRGLTPASGTERDSSSRGLAAPIVSDAVATAELDAHALATAPGTIEAPQESTTGDADSTARRRSVSPEVLAELEKRPSTPSARKSFAPPKDSPSAPPGSRVVLPREASEGLAAASPSSRPAVRVPRPSQPPADADDAVRGWRASDPSHAESDAMPAEVVIPPPARLPSVRGPTSSPPVASSVASGTAAARVSAPPSVSGPSQSPMPSAGQAPTELDGRLVILGGVGALLTLFALYYLLFL